MLVDVTNKPRKVKPTLCKETDAIQTYLKKEHPRTVERVLKTIDEGIERAIQTCGRLVFTKTGIIMGEKSMGPKQHVDHAWDSVVSVMGPDRPCIFTMGALVKWRISLRPETWLMYKRDSGQYDHLTGEEYTVAEYWVNESFVLH